MFKFLCSKFLIFSDFSPIWKPRRLSVNNLRKIAIIDRPDILEQPSVYYFDADQIGKPYSFS